MGLLTKEQKSAGDGVRPFEDIPVLDLGAGVVVRIRAMEESEYEDFQDSLYKRRGKSVEANMKMVRRRLVSLCAVTESGETIWTEDELRRKPTRAMAMMVNAAMRVNGMEDGDLDDLAGSKKNSGTGQDAGSSSTSVSPRPMRTLSPSPTNSANESAADSSKSG